MKVKILKAELDSYWYADKIGEKFKVEDNNSHGEWILLKNETGDESRFIQKSDCEIIPKKAKLKNELELYKSINSELETEIEDLKLVNQTYLEKLQELEKARVKLINSVHFRDSLITQQAETIKM